MTCCLHLLYRLPQSVFLNICYVPKFKQINHFVVNAPRLSNKLMFLCTEKITLNCNHYPFSSLPSPPPLPLPTKKKNLEDKLKGGKYFSHQLSKQSNADHSISAWTNRR